MFFFFLQKSGMFTDDRDRAWIQAAVPFGETTLDLHGYISDWWHSLRGKGFQMITKPSFPVSVQWTFRAHEREGRCKFLFRWIVPSYNGGEAERAGCLLSILCSPAQEGQFWSHFFGRVYFIFFHGQANQRVGFLHPHRVRCAFIILQWEGVGVGAHKKKKNSVIHNGSQHSEDNKRPHSVICFPETDFTILSR